MKMFAITVLSVLFTALAITGCATVQADRPNPPVVAVASSPMPSLIGTWTGVWSGTMSTPLKMVIESYEAGEIKGVFTYTHHGSDYASPFTSVVVLKNGKPSFTVEHSRGQIFKLMLTADGAMEGRGQSPYHDGPVRLTHTG